MVFRFQSRPPKYTMPPLYMYGNPWLASRGRCFHISCRQQKMLLQASGSLFFKFLTQLRRTPSGGKFSKVDNKSYVAWSEVSSLESRSTKSQICSVVTNPLECLPNWTELSFALPLTSKTLIHQNDMYLQNNCCKYFCSRPQWFFLRATCVWPGALVSAHCLSSCRPKMRWENVILGPIDVMMWW